MKLKNKEVSLRIVELADAIKLKPDDPALDAEIRELQRSEGEWVADAIINRLTADVAYNQSSQDYLRWQSKPAELAINPLHPLPVLYYATALTEATASHDITDLLTQLVAGDVSTIIKEAKLRGIERAVWKHWLNGKSIAEMQGWIVHPDGTPYGRQKIYEIFDRVRAKILRCPSLGWKTALAEDQARGSAGPARWNRASHIISHRLE